MYTLVQDTIRDSDVDDLIEWLKTYPRLTKGPLTVEFENKWAEWLGTKHAVFVNSGSSANLLTLSALVESGKISRNAKVVVPAVSWATDLAPVMQLGLTPILCDCNLDDLSIDLKHFERICNEEKPECLIFVSVLGIVPNMDKVVELCKQYKVTLVEDTCESFGSSYKQKKLGNFGIASTFSTYFGHHLSTIEGGIVATNNTEFYNVLLSIRSHGWLRDCDDDFAKQKQSAWSVSDFASQYTFHYPGFNLRATDLQAFLGIRQLDYADDVSQARSHNFNSYIKNISNDLWKPKTQDDSFVSNFCYPVICKNRKELISKLNENGIENRPLIAGSMAKQPFFVSRYGAEILENADLVHRFGLYLPNNHRIDTSDIEHISNIVNKTAKPL